MNQTFRASIDACTAFNGACDPCASACLAEDNPTPVAACIRLNIDCVEIRRRSPMQRWFSRARGIARVLPDLPWSIGPRPCPDRPVKEANIPMKYDEPDRVLVERQP